MGLQALRPDSRPHLWSPGGPENPAAIYLRLHTERIELWSAVLDVMPPPHGYSAALLLREGDGWRYADS